MGSVLDGLADRTEGELLAPRSDGYEAALGLYTRSLRGRPLAVLKARGTGDVAAAVAAARRAEIPLSVRGGGHSGAGFAVADGGLMLDLSGLRGVSVDPDRARAVSEPGATWGDYDRATQRHGLASTGGIVSSTGVAGLTLGGGIGALRGLRGLSVDQLRAVELVTADGSVVRADADTRPELFWAVRGGGGNFGVVVRFEFALHPVRRMVTGALTWPLESAEAVVREFRGRAAELPDHIVGEVVFASPGGTPSVMVTPRVIGTARDADPLLGPLRGIGAPNDTVSERSYIDGQRFMDPMAEWGMRTYWNTCTLRHLDDDVVAALTRAAKAAPSPASAIIVEHLHGAVSRADPEATAVGFRHAPYNVFVEAKWREPADDDANRRWSHEVVAALAPHAAGGAYVNYLPADAGPDDLRDAYGAARFRRLQRIKAAYDPANLFRANQNIPPSP